MRNLIFSTLAVVLALASAVRLEAQDRFREKRARTMLVEAVETGTAIFNAGDSLGCYRVYQGALSSVLPLLDGRPELLRAISAGRMDAIRQPSAFDKAWRLRRLIDLTLESLR